MPYIEKKDRDLLSGPNHQATTPGELNYLFTMLAKKYMNYKGESYQTYNDIIGALEGCKLEMYRRRVLGYEDQKRWKNGDVWEEQDSDPAVDTWGKVLKE